MGMKKYNSYAPRESLGKHPRPPFWPQNGLNGPKRPPKIQNRNKTPNICIYTNFKVGNSMATLFCENLQKLTLFGALKSPENH